MKVKQLIRLIYGDVEIWEPYREQSCEPADCPHYDGCCEDCELISTKRENFSLFSGDSGDVPIRLADRTVDEICAEEHVYMKIGKKEYVRPCVKITIVEENND